jgi:hypothetical protein
MTQEFGITTADIKAQVHELRINASSSPSTTQVEENITFMAAQIQQECAAVGISTPGLSAGDADYILLKKAVIYAVTGEILIAKNRGDGAAGAYYIERYDKIMDSIRIRPDRIKVDDVGPDLATFIDATPDATTGTGGDCSATDGSCDIPFFRTVSGKIIRGNSL